MSLTVTITNARLIEDGKIVAPVWIGDKSYPAECYSDDKDDFKRILSTVRAILLRRVLDERREFGFMKAGATYTIDFTYKYKDNA